MTNTCSLGETRFLIGQFKNPNVEWKLHWLLRLGVFMEFVGHGACGVATKAGWLPYFHVFAISDSVAWKMMPLVGGLDIALGAMALLNPCRTLLLYMAVWGCWEVVERGGSYVAPLAALFALALLKTTAKSRIIQNGDLPAQTV